LVFGFDRLKRIVNISILEILAVTGVVLFVGTGFLCMFLGGEFLNYSYLSGDNLVGQHLGIFIVELGVFLTVFSVLLLLFFCFVDR
jgi:multicomponent Na+:H+ antiporter subunit B